MAEGQSGDPQKPTAFRRALRLLQPEFTNVPVPVPKLLGAIENRLEYQRQAQAELEYQREVQAELEDRRRMLIDEALANVPAPAKVELEHLSERTREDLRLHLLQGLEETDRDNWAAVLAMRSAENTGSRLLMATWGLVAATIALVVATAALVMVALMPK